MNEQCPACGTVTERSECCGIYLAGPFRMTTPRVRALRAYAHGRKGLDAETYRMHVRAVGCESTLDLSRDQYNALLRRLRQLPDRMRSRPGSGGHLRAPRNSDPVEDAIHAQTSLIGELMAAHRFSAVEAADYLHFCRENPIAC